jgi:hypothetical protein
MVQGVSEHYSGTISKSKGQNDQRLGSQEIYLVCLGDAGKVTMTNLLQSKPQPSPTDSAAFCFSVGAFLDI